MGQSLLAQALLVLVGLQAKHFVCDGPLQTLGMVKAKSHYGRPLGLLHAAIQAAGTLCVLLVAGLAPLLAVKLALLDGVVHYHVDFTKENTVKHMQWTVADGPYWWALTLDQTLHHMTYVLLVWLSFAA